MKKVRKLIIHKSIKFFFIIFFWIIVIEFFSFFIYEHILPGPLVKKGDYFIKNIKYGFHNYHLNLNKEFINVKKDKDTLRIFSYGASSTAGWPYGLDFSYTSYLKKYLQTIYSNKKIETINFSVLGFDSLEVRYIIEKSIKYLPDIIIVYTGHNAVEEYNIKKIKSGFLNNISLQFKNFSLFKLINHLINIINTGYLSKWTVIPDRTRDQIYDKSIITKNEKKLLIKNYTKNINSIISLALNNNIKLVIIKPIYNMFDFGPVYSYYNKALTKTDKDLYVYNLKKGIDLFKNKKINQALTIFQKCQKLDSEVAILQFYLAKCYYLINNLERALYHRKKSIDLDGVWWVCTGQHQEILNKIKEQQNIVVINLLKKIAEKTGEKFLNNKWLIDEIHPTPFAHSMIADILLEKMIKNKMIPAGFEENKSFNYRINLLEEMGQRRYSVLQQMLAIDMYHISFWSFDPFPVLERSRNYIEKYFNYTDCKPSLNAEIYYYLINKELGKKQNISKLVNKWGIGSIKKVLKSRYNDYNHFNNLKEELNSFKK